MAAVDFGELVRLTYKVDARNIVRTVPLPSNCQRTGTAYNPIKFVSDEPCHTPEVASCFRTEELISDLNLLNVNAGPILLHPPSADVETILSVVGTPVVCKTEGVCHPLLCGFC